MKVDELKLYHGDDIKISETITICQPTLEQIIEKGENAFFAFCQSFTAHNLDDNIIVFLTDLDIDFTQVTDWDLFVCLSPEFDMDISGLFFKDLDFSTMRPLNDNNKNVYLKNNDGIVITESIYNTLVEYMRKLANIPVPQFTKILNLESQKKMAIAHARRKLESAKKKEMYCPSKSFLLPLVSSVVNDCGSKETIDTIFGRKIYYFWDTVKRIQVRNNSDHLFTGLYSGCLSLKDNPAIKKELDWMRTLK
jgi:hypothetical protein